MKRVLPIVLLLAALGAAAFYGRGLIGGGKQPLKAGTSLKLVLMRQLEAGKDHEGDEVPFIVAEDVQALNGGIAITKGSVVKGRIVQSRGENMLSGITNRPGRLAVSFAEVRTVDGQTVRVAADVKGTAESMYSFTRGNTGKQDVIEKLERLSADQDVKSTLDQIQGAFAKGETPKFDDPKSKEALAKISKELDLKALGKAIAEDRVDEIAGVLKSTKEAGTAATVLSGNFTLAAVLELADVAGDIGSKVQRMLGGRTIRAYPGTEVTAYVAQGAEVRTK